MFGAVGIIFLVVVLVAGGEGQAGGGVSCQGTLKVADGASFLNVERVLGFLSAQMEGDADGLRVIPPIGELDLEDVVTIFGH